MQSMFIVLLPELWNKNTCSVHERVVLLLLIK